MRPRMDGSRERYCSSSRSCPAAGAGIAVSSRRKSVTSGLPLGRAARTICRPPVVVMSRPQWLLRSQLTQSAEPVFEVIGPRDLSVSDRLDIGRHDPEALSGVRHTEQFAGGCSSDLTSEDEP